MAQHQLREPLFQAVAEINTESKEVVKTIADSLREEGMKKGIQRGIEQGIEQGIEKGIEKGLEREREQGAQALLELLLERFPDADDTLREKVLGVRTKNLPRWSLLIHSCSSPEELAATL